MRVPVYYKPIGFDSLCVRYFSSESEAHEWAEKHRDKFTKCIVEDSAYNARIREEAKIKQAEWEKKMIAKYGEDRSKWMIGGYFGTNRFGRCEGGTDACAFGRRGDY